MFQGFQEEIKFQNLDQALASYQILCGVCKLNMTSFKLYDHPPHNKIIKELLHPFVYVYK